MNQTTSSRFDANHATKKRLKNSALLLLIFVLLPGTLISCESNINSTTSTEIEIEEASAYSKLTPEEKRFVDKFVLYAANSFKVPSSIEIRLLNHYKGDSSTGGDFWGIVIASTNSFGGTAVSDFFLVETGDFVNAGPTQNSMVHDPIYDCKKITQAIQERLSR